jgi:leader peptidase (prepilin peptidase)/N-methyltransferase
MELEWLDLTLLIKVLSVTFVFLMGVSIGSWLNVCIARLPTERSVIWPNSHCLACLRPLPWYCNIPLISYLWLRGRCKFCGARFSVRYFAIELLTGLGFVFLFWFEVVRNWHGLRFLDEIRPFSNPFVFVPIRGLVMFVYHCIFLGFLIVAAGSDIENRTIPLSVTLTGTFIGLCGATLFPWPWPSDPSVANVMPRQSSWWSFHPDRPIPNVPLGMYPWPVWGPLPKWMPPGSPLLGLATGLAGVVVGQVLVRVVRLIFGRATGREGLGMGDADLMMLTGAFLGWQPVVLAFFAGAVIALFLAIPILLIRGDNASPFGPGLVLGTLLVWFAWPWLNTVAMIQSLFFDPVMLGAIVLIAAVLTVVLAYFVGLRYREEPADPAHQSSQAS